MDTLFGSEHRGLGFKFFIYFFIYSSLFISISFSYYLYKRRIRDLFREYGPRMV